MVTKDTVCSSKVTALLLTFYVMVVRVALVGFGVSEVLWGVNIYWYLGHIWTR